MCMIHQLQSLYFVNENQLFAKFDGLLLVSTPTSFRSVERPFLRVMVTG
jgi:hypothetical protein